MSDSVDYARLGRQHARRALREYFKISRKLYAQSCEHKGRMCEDCLVAKAADILYNLQLKDSIDLNSDFRPPSSEDEESEYNNSSMDLIKRTVNRHMNNSSYFGGNFSSYITEPEEAYELALELMKPITKRVAKAMLSEELSLDEAKRQVDERCRSELNSALDEKAGLPKVHKAIMVCFDKGVSNAIGKAQDEICNYLSKASENLRDKKRFDFNLGENKTTNVDI